jgi:hypothetical protein
VAGTNLSYYAAVAVLPGYPYITGAAMLSGDRCQVSFTDGNAGSAYIVLASTNISTPLTNWTALAAVSNISPGFFQYTDTQATNAAKFYDIRSH